jgi:hypothetical protein
MSGTMMRESVVEVEAGHQVPAAVAAHSVLPSTVHSDLEGISRNHADVRGRVGGAEAVIVLARGPGRTGPVPGPDRPLEGSSQGR